MCKIGALQTELIALQTECERISVSNTSLTMQIKEWKHTEALSKDEHNILEAILCKGGKTYTRLRSEVGKASDAAIHTLQIDPPRLPEALPTPIFDSTRYEAELNRQCHQLARVKEALFHTKTRMIQRNQESELLRQLKSAISTDLCEQGLNLLSVNIEDLPNEMLGRLFCTISSLTAH